MKLPESRYEKIKFLKAVTAGRVELKNLDAAKLSDDELKEIAELINRLSGLVEIIENEEEIRKQIREFIDQRKHLFEKEFS